MTASSHAGVAEGEPAVVAEQELQTLSYAVSHDLSASVRHLTMFSSLMASDIGSERTERQSRFAEQLQAANEHCVAMLEQLLVYSRVQSRGLDRRLHDSTDAIRLAALRLTVAAGLSPENISVGGLGEVDADPDLLAQAVTAILDNAVKFRRKDASLRVVVEPAHDIAFWRVRVRDNGVGVEARHREAAFSMFRRLNSPGAFPGVGAGLAICRRIARRHGGEARFLDCTDGAYLELALPRPIKDAKRRSGKSA